MASPLALPIGETAALDALRLDARPLHGADCRLRRAAGAGRRRAPGAARRGQPRHPRVLPRARTDHPQADRGARLHAPWPSRATGPTPTASAATCRAPAMTRDAEEALRGFRRFPTWMWRNAEVLDFVGWLRAHNEQLAPSQRAVGFYGLDLYSLGASMEAVVAYLEEVDPAGRRAGPPSLRVPAPVLRRQRRLRAGGAARRQRAMPPARARAARRAAPSRRRLPARRMVSSPRTATSWPSRTRRSSPTPRSTTARCSAVPRPPGTCATGTWPTRSTSSRSTSPATGTRARSSCGSTTRTSATPARPRWPSAAS